jgi:hypothetical protein
MVPNACSRLEVSKNELCLELLSSVFPRKTMSLLFLLSYICKYTHVRTQDYGVLKDSGCQRQK